MEYKFNDIEEEVKKFWKENDVYRVSNDTSLKKFYVLDMFPYPSGAGLHVGHPLGYIASDIYARYKRLKGFNVLHPMGFDSFGLPAEQYAIQTGQHPADTTEKNIATFKEQLDKIGFSFDWSRELRTSDPGFYKWTQWIFIQLFHSWYNKTTDKAERIQKLIEEFEKNGNENIDAAVSLLKIFTASEWHQFSEKQKSDMLLNYRIAYLADSWVNWCPALGTVLANDEVKDGVSERGGYPVERKLMRQWSLRITAYADRLLNDLNKIEWSESVKETQRNWIGRSEGCSVRFEVKGEEISTPLAWSGAGGEDNNTPSNETQDQVHITPSDKAGGEETGTPLLWRGAGGEVNPRYITAENKVWFNQKKNVREFRKQSTEAEKLLWQQLRNRKLGDRFRRQHLIDHFIVDFVSLEKKLIIELDGEIHKDQKEYDQYRTENLESLGYRVIRFWNREVIDSMGEVLQRIAISIKLPHSQPMFAKEENALIPHPQPLSKGEGSRPAPEQNKSSFMKTIPSASIEVFTTRPDTIYGVTFITLAPEHELVSQIATQEYKKQVEEYVNYAKNRSERDRMTDVKNITGQFTGAYVIHPFTYEPVPVWIGEYVLATYGTGAVMGVPGHDERDHRFATHFGLSITSIIDGVDVSVKSFDDKNGTLCSSGFLNGLSVPEAIKTAIEEIEDNEIGERRINFKLRDAIFGRQRYWGEPIPIYYDADGIPHTIDTDDLPLLLPEVDKYLPTEDGEPPLARAKDWKYKGVYDYESTTMPGWAGSSWYYLRYGNPHNTKEFASKESIDYWQNIDFYVGGDEHATGHLLYFRFWTKFLFDLGLIPFDEPAKKLVNQGKIQGFISKIYKLNIVHLMNRVLDFDAEIYLSKNWADEFSQGNKSIEELIVKIKRAADFEIDIANNNNSGNPITMISESNINSKYVENDLLDMESFKRANNAIVVPEDTGEFICKEEVGKMSKSKNNVVNPDEVVEKYGADVFRLYEMFLGPLEQSKPWDTKGIEGVFRFIKKLWKLFYRDEGSWMVNEDEPSREEVKILHRTIKKIGDDIEALSYNTSVSAFMICVNELGACHKRKILEPLLVLLSPFAPFITEYLWKQLGHSTSITRATFPDYDQAMLVESSFEYPVAVNGKTRFKMNFDLNLSPEQIEKEVIAAENLQKYFDGKKPKKVIVVKGRMINVVV